MVIKGPWNRPRYYILMPDHSVQGTDDIMVWGPLFEDSDARRVAADDIGGYFISTVFLGVDHDFGFGSGRPVLFETMVFARDEPDDAVNPLDLFTRRYCTWDEAVAGHADVLAMVKQHLGERGSA